jgi:Plavaka transposase
MDVRATDALMTHCRREIYHAALTTILDNEFVTAWTSGILMECYDGVTRRIFPRIFTWSADYPEK